MAKYINLNEYTLGVIFPDIENMLIRCGFASSKADFILKAMRIKEPSIKGDKKVFRIIRGFGERNDELLSYENRRYLKDEYKRLLGSSINRLELNFKELRNFGYWSVYKGFFSGYESPVSSYVIKLCEHEIDSLSIIHRSKNCEEIINRIESELRTWLRLPTHILVAISNVTPVEREELDRIKGILHIHRFMNLVAIFEFADFSHKCATPIHAANVISV